MQYVRKNCFILGMLLFLFCLSQTVFAENVEALIEQTEDIYVPYGYRVSDTAQSALSGTFNLSFSEVLKKAADLLLSALKTQLGAVGKVTAAGLLCGVFTHMLDRSFSYLQIAGGAIVGAMVFSVFSGALRLVEEGMDTMLLFTQSLFPAVTAAVITTGQVHGGALASGIFAAMQIFIFICRNIFIPWVCILAALEITDWLGEERFLKGINVFLKQSYKHVVGIMLVLYGGVTALSTVAGKATGTLVGKTVKYAAQSFVPLIGGALADSLEMVQASARAVSGALGVGGIIGLLLTGFFPLIEVLSLAIAVKISGALCAVAGEEKTAGIIISTGEALVRLCGILLSVGVMFVLGIFMLLKAGGGV